MLPRDSGGRWEPPQAPGRFCAVLLQHPSPHSPNLAQCLLGRTGMLRVASGKGQLCLCPSVRPGGRSPPRAPHRFPSPSGSAPRSRSAALCTALLWKLGGIDDDVSSVIILFSFPSSPVLRGKPNRNQRFSAPPGEARSAGHPAAPSGGTERPRAGGEETFLLMDFTPRLFPRSHLYLEAESLEKKRGKKKKKNTQKHTNGTKQTQKNALGRGSTWRGEPCRAVPCRFVPSGSAAARPRDSTTPGSCHGQVRLVGEMILGLVCRGSLRWFHRGLGVLFFFVRAIILPFPTDCRVQ